MKHFVFYLMTFLFCSNLAFAQYSRLLHKPHWEQTEALSELYDNMIEFKIDRPILDDTLAGMRNLAIRESDNVLKMESDFLELSYDVLVEYKELDGMISFQKEQEKAGNIYFACRAAEAISKSFWYSRNYEKALNWHLHLDELLKLVSIEEFPEKAIFLTGIGSDYRYFGDYRKSITYFKQVAEFKVKDVYINAWRHAINNMAFTYRQLGQLDSSDYYFDRLLKHSEETSEQWLGIASGNVGYNHFLKGEYEDALPLLLRDVRLAEKYKDRGLAAQSSIPVADIYTIKGELDSALYFIEKAYGYIRSNGDTDRLRNLYPVLSKWEAAKGNMIDSNKYLDSALVATKKYNEKFSAVQLMRANQLVMITQKEKAIQTLNEEARRNKIIRNAIIGGLLLILIAALIIYEVQVQKNRMRQKLKDHELEKTQSDLESAQKLLTNYTLKIQENSNLIQSMEEQSLQDEQNQVLQQLRERTVLTDEDWDAFQKEFRKIFPRLITSLLHHDPKLTPSELRFLLLLKLDMQNQEIANAMGISPSSIRVTWHRLRKKLDLEKSVQPRELFEMHFSEV
ncbi:tetratricopeptide repeat protein [Algoriphagus sp. Y33]|uniref:tetratricopeptide repeat protein n=1 Tax=Algoriphagus sp. Y33 TaxID=2772483 RepID=UPI00177C344D|nr:tetratricopeptide repeat protein [Algoriphagus sp. Y33]